MVILWRQRVSSIGCLSHNYNKTSRLWEVIYWRPAYLCGYLVTLLRKDTFLLKRTNSVRTDNQRYFLAVNGESFLLKVRLEDAIGTTQREANIVAVLLAFTGELVSCYHNLIDFTLFGLGSQGVDV